MKTYILSIFLLLFSINFIFANEKDTYIPDFVTNNYSEKITIKNPTKVIVNVDHEFTIYRPDCDCESFYLNYGYLNKINDLKASISQRGNTRKIKKTDIKDYSAVSSYSIYEENRIKYIKFSNTSYPYTVNISYEIEYNTTKFLPVYQPMTFNNAVENSSFTIINESDLGLNTKVFQKQYFDVIEENATTCHYEIKDQEMIPIEDNLPSINQILPMVFIATDKFTIEKYEVDNSNWESLANFYFELNNTEESISAALKAELLALTKNLKTDREKAIAIYKKTQEDLRYVSVQLGIGGWKAFSPQYVEEHKYGDCKAMSCYLKACLEAVEIQANMVIINSSYNADIASKDFVSSRFNHAILYIPSLDMWLDATQKYAPSGYLGPRMSDKFTMVLDAEKSYVKQTPNLQKDNNQISILLNTKIEATQTKFEVAIKNEGYYDYRNRELLLSSSAKELEKYYYETRDFSIENLSPISFDVEENEPVSNLAYNYTSSTFPVASGNRFFLPILSDYQMENPLKKTSERVHPFQFQLSKTVNFTNNISLPEKYTVEYLPENISLESDFGNYQLRLTHNENTITIQRTYTIKHGFFEATLYQEAFDFFQKIQRADTEEIVLIKK